MSLISYLFTMAPMPSPSHGRDMAVEDTEVTMNVLVLKCICPTVQIFKSQEINPASLEHTSDAGEGQKERVPCKKPP